MNDRAQKAIELRVLMNRQNQADTQTEFHRLDKLVDVLLEEGLFDEMPAAVSVAPYTTIGEEYLSR